MWFLRKSLKFQSTLIISAGSNVEFQIGTNDWNYLQSTDADLHKVMTNAHMVLWTHSDDKSSHGPLDTKWWQKLTWSFGYKVMTNAHMALWTHTVVMTKAHMVLWIQSNDKCTHGPLDTYGSDDKSSHGPLDTKWWQMHTWPFGHIVMTKAHMSL
jgi:hypothetical protein